MVFSKKILFAILMLCNLAFSGLFAQTKQVTELLKNGHPDTRFFYAPDGKCSKIENWNKRGLVSQEILSYESGFLSERAFIDSAGTTDWVERYEYNSKGFLLKCVREKKQSRVSSFEFAYEKNVLTGYSGDKISKKGKRKSVEVVYQWDAGDLTVVQFFEIEDGLRDLRRTVKYRYNKTLNPFKGLPDGLREFSDHNVLAKESIDRFGLIEPDESYDQVWEYDATGLPIRFRRNYVSGKSTLFEIKYSDK